ncbi:hypothetical protein V8D89_010703 [Ganoderma adspersum]
MWRQCAWEVLAGLTTEVDRFQDEKCVRPGCNLNLNGGSVGCRKCELRYCSQSCLNRDKEHTDDCALYSGHHRGVRSSSKRRGTRSYAYDWWVRARELRLSGRDVQWAMWVILAGLVILTGMCDASRGLYEYII